MDKLPATAELIRWVELLAVMLDGGSLKEKPEAIKESLGVLFKSGGDVEEAARIVDGWAS
jgi:hypothetical protein